MTMSWSSAAWSRSKSTKPSPASSCTSIAPVRRSGCDEGTATASRWRSTSICSICGSPENGRMNPTSSCRARSASRCTLLVHMCTLTSTPGCARRYAATSATQLPYVAVPITPTSSLPNSPSPASRTTEYAVSRRSSTARASVTNCRPASVRWTDCRSRSNSATPSSSSSFLICWLSGGCAMPSCAAARLKCSESATARKYRSRLSCIVPAVPLLQPVRLARARFANARRGRSQRIAEVDHAGNAFAFPNAERVQNGAFASEPAGSPKAAHAFTVRRQQQVLRCGARGGVVLLAVDVVVGPERDHRDDDGSPLELAALFFAHLRQRVGRDAVDLQGVRGDSPKGRSGAAGDHDEPPRLADVVERGPRRRVEGSLEDGAVGRLRTHLGNAAPRTDCFVDVHFGS